MGPKRTQPAAGDGAAGRLSPLPPLPPGAEGPPPAAPPPDPVSGGPTANVTNPLEGLSESPPRLTRMGSPASFRRRRPHSYRVTVAAPERDPSTNPLDTLQQSPGPRRRSLAALRHAPPRDPEGTPGAAHPRSVRDESSSQTCFSPAGSDAAVALLPHPAEHAQEGPSPRAGRGESGPPCWPDPAPADRPRPDHAPREPPHHPLLPPPRCSSGSSTHTELQDRWRSPTPPTGPPLQPPAGWGAGLRRRREAARPGPLPVAQPADPLQLDPDERRPRGRLPLGRPASRSAGWRGCLHCASALPSVRRALFAAGVAVLAYWGVAGLGAAGDSAASSVAMTHWHFAVSLQGAAAHPRELLPDTAGVGVGAAVFSDAHGAVSALGAVANMTYLHTGALPGRAAAAAVVRRGGQSPAALLVALSAGGAWVMLAGGGAPEPPRLTARIGGPANGAQWAAASIAAAPGASVAVVALRDDGGSLYAAVTPATPAAGPPLAGAPVALRSSAAVHGAPVALTGGVVAAAGSANSAPPPPCGAASAAAGTALVCCGDEFGAAHCYLLDAASLRVLAVQSAPPQGGERGPPPRLERWAAGAAGGFTKLARGLVEAAAPEFAEPAEGDAPAPSSPVVGVHVGAAAGGAAAAVLAHADGGCSVLNCTAAAARLECGGLRLLRGALQHPCSGSGVGIAIVAPTPAEGAAAPSEALSAVFARSSPDAKGTELTVVALEPPYHQSDGYHLNAHVVSLAAASGLGGGFYAAVATPAPALLLGDATGARRYAGIVAARGRASSGGPPVVQVAEPGHCFPSPFEGLASPQPLWWHPALDSPALHPPAIWGMARPVAEARGPETLCACREHGPRRAGGAACAAQH
eukprot:TRINITY_DN65896_c0_g1_i1.p1 TRINITY_DN65896_c0_g1~~TRINITY_DN65896_c0_g1_i1.p1  ORF type:complete len:885 (+),score=172.88 TRINITY_DN65896_c0_g1_i1:64-2655(+)